MKLNRECISEENVPFNAANQGLPCLYKLMLRKLCQHFSVYTLRGVLQMNIITGLYYILGLHFWSSKYTSSCHSMQVFVLNYMVIFLLFKSRNRNLPSCHVFNISPAFTFVILLITVSLENVCGKCFISCYVYIIKWKFFRNSLKNWIVVMKLICRGFFA